MITHSLHGFNIRDGGKKTTGKLVLKVQAEGVTVIEHKYGHLNLLGVLRKNNAIAAKIVPQLKPEDVVWGHSNGGAVAVKCLQQGAIIDKLILINAALDKHFEFPEGVNEIHVFHSKNDKTVILAKWFRKLVFWRNTFLWGEMGNTGYKGNDKRVINHLMNPKHSGIFKDKNIEGFSAEIIKIIKDTS